MHSPSRPYLFEFGKIGDSSIGYISVAEGSGLPFAVQRVYWTYFTPHEVIRGHHAHKKLQQVIVAVAGQITLDVINSEGIKETFNLTKPNQALYIPPMCWRTLQFSHSAVLMCLSSEPFSESDYIRDFDEFLKLTKRD